MSRAPNRRATLLANSFDAIRRRARLARRGQVIVLDDGVARSGHDVNAYETVQIVVGFGGRTGGDRTATFANRRHHVRRRTGLAWRREVVVFDDEAAGGDFLDADVAVAVVIFALR